MSDTEKRTVTFHLTGGGDIEIDMTPAELTEALKMVDRETGGGREQWVT